MARSREVEADDSVAAPRQISARYAGRIEWAVCLPGRRLLSTLLTAIAIRAAASARFDPRQGLSPQPAFGPSRAEQRFKIENRRVGRGL
jgi:hypothetical protein